MDVVMAPDNSRAERLTKLVETHQQILLDLCCMVLRDHELARDAVQETFLKAYRGMDTFRGENERAWLTRIALNTCRDMKRSAWHRHLNRSITPEDIPFAGDDPLPPESMDLADAIMRLPDRYRDVILLHYFQDMPITDIAPIVGVTKSMVSRRVKKARALLHGLLGEEYPHGSTS